MERDEHVDHRRPSRMAYEAALLTDHGGETVAGALSNVRGQFPSTAS